MSTPKDQLAFWQTLDELQAERDAAFETRDTDRERWQAAKHAYAEFRRAMRSLSGNQSSVVVEARVVAETADVGVAAENTGG